MQKFEPLWYNEANAVICTRKELQEFVQQHTNLLGNPVIAVRGQVRLLAWKSIGAGLYKMFTKEWPTCHRGV